MLGVDKYDGWGMNYLQRGSDKQMDDICAGDYGMH
jgi:hypothetical protein